MTSDSHTSKDVAALTSFLEAQIHSLVRNYNAGISDSDTDALAEYFITNVIPSFLNVPPHGLSKAAPTHCLAWLESSSDRKFIESMLVLDSTLPQEFALDMFKLVHDYCLCCSSLTTPKMEGLELTRSWKTAFSTTQQHGETVSNDTEKLLAKIQAHDQGIDVVMRSLHQISADPLPLSLNYKHASFRRVHLPAVPSSSLSFQCTNLPQHYLRGFNTALPIHSRLDDILYAVMNNDVTIVSAETGAGKSTALPQYVSALFDANGVTPSIVVTEPRRLSCVALSERVAKELSAYETTRTVGYTVRFASTANAGTAISFVTEGILLKQLAADRLLSHYNCIIIDESHERTRNTDILLGVLKEVLRARLGTLKVIVTSASMDIDLFLSYFSAGLSDPMLRLKVSHVHVAGRVFPVEVVYEKRPVSDITYFDTVVDFIVSLHFAAISNCRRNLTPIIQRALGECLSSLCADIVPENLASYASGDILCFLTGYDEISSVKAAIIERHRGIMSEIRPFYTPNNGEAPLLIDLLECYSSMELSRQRLIFKPSQKNTRKIVLATNIAETSLTIPNITIVLDCGYAKVNSYDALNRIDILAPTLISKSQALQRCGRAGRVTAGLCYRCYSHEVFDRMADHAVPEIQRCSLVSTVLLILCLSMDPFSFEFLSRPTIASIMLAIESLTMIGALSPEGVPTDIGRQLCTLPLEPYIGIALLLARRRGCLSEMIDIMAVVSEMLNGKTILANGLSRKSALPSEITSPHGDHLSYLKIVVLFRDTMDKFTAESHSKDSSFVVRKMKDWCAKYSLCFSTLVNISRTSNQLAEMMQAELSITEQDDCENILKTLLLSNFSNVARLVNAQTGAYARLSDLSDTKEARALKQPYNMQADCYQELFIHPSSVLWQKDVQYIVFTRIVKTSRVYMHGCSRIDGRWLIELQPEIFSEKEKKARRNNQLKIKW